MDIVGARRRDRVDFCNRHKARQRLTVLLILNRQDTAFMQRRPVTTFETPCGVSRLNSNALDLGTERQDQRTTP